MKPLTAEQKAQRAAYQRKYRRDNFRKMADHDLRRTARRQKYFQEYYRQRKLREARELQANYWLHELSGKPVAEQMAKLVG